MAKVKNSISIENAVIKYRNFSGKGGDFNPEGQRNFCVFLEKEDADRLTDEGWNVKWTKPKDPSDEPEPFLKVRVSFDNIPPKIVIVSSKGKTILDVDSINILDWADISDVDLIITPYNWEMKGSGKSGVTAYVKAMYVTIVEDEFEKKYYDVPDSAVGSIGGCGHCDECDGTCDCNHGD